MCLKRILAIVCVCSSCRCGSVPLMLDAQFLPQDAFAGIRDYSTEAQAIAKFYGRIVPQTFSKAITAI